MLWGFSWCGVGSNHCRLRLFGWEKSGHGLTSRPRETSKVAFLNELLVLFGYPPSFGSALLEGTLPLKYCVTRLTHKVPTSARKSMGKLLTTRR